MATVSRTHKNNLRRMITKLPDFVVKELDEHDVALRVCNWISWGKFLQDRVIRLGFALLLRREASALGGRSTNGWVWPEPQVMSAIDKVFRKSPQFASLVRAGILSSARVPDNVGVLTSGWRTVWPQILGAMQSMNLRTAMDQASALVSQRVRAKRRKKVKLQPRDCVLVDMLYALRQAAIRGEITLDQLPPGYLPKLPNQKG